MVALVQAMTARGHEVTVLSQPCVRDRAVAAGASFEAFADFGDYATDVAIEEQLDLVLTSLAGVGTGEQLAALAGSVGAEAVVVDCNLAAAAAAAEALPLPSAVLFHSMYATFTDVWFAELWPLLAESLNGARSAFGVPEAAGWPEVFAGQQRLLAAVPASFDAPVAAVPPKLRHHGFLVPEPDAVGGPALVSAPAGEPTVLVSLSTTHLGPADLLERIVAAVGARAVRGLVTTGGQADPASLGAAEHVQCFDWLPHPAVLPETDVVITHGGLGTCAGALSHGVPLVCLPLGRDQHLNAGRVEAVGAGVSLSSEASPDAIAEALDLVLGDPAYAAAARRIADESRAAGGAPAAVADLESLL
jgi:UDP:flavonoid glycosyltransferase YjiC (YdhE family)